jgi:1,2-phenylacetyl-CoA epoxidase PaaB subunit
MIKLNQEDKRYHIDTARKVFVYKNLHKDCWSVKQDGLVKAHATEIELWDCAFRVNKTGRERVLKEKRKNVHAGISGYIDHLGMGAYGTVGALNALCVLHDSFPYPFSIFPVTYNPYKYETFVDKETEKPIYNSNYSKLEPKQVFASSAL